MPANWLMVSVISALPTKLAEATPRPLSPVPPLTTSLPPLPLLPTPVLPLPLAAASAAAITRLPMIPLDVLCGPTWDACCCCCLGRRLWPAEPEPGEDSATAPGGVPALATTPRCCCSFFESCFFDCFSFSTREHGERKTSAPPKPTAAASQKVAWYPSVTSSDSYQVHTFYGP